MQAPQTQDANRALAAVWSSASHAIPPPKPQAPSLTLSWVRIGRVWGDGRWEDALGSAATKGPAPVPGPYEGFQRAPWALEQASYLGVGEEGH